MAGGWPDTPIARQLFGDKTSKPGFIKLYRLTVGINVAAFVAGQAGALEAIGIPAAAASAGGSQLARGAEFSAMRAHDAAEPGFTLKLMKSGAVEIRHHGRIAATLRDHGARRFLQEARSGSLVPMPSK
jgi:hypothetical protein